MKKNREKLFKYKLNNYLIIVPNDMNWTFLGGDYYEKNVIHFFDRIVKSLDFPILFDVGANFGYYSIRYADECSQIFSYEPVSSTFNTLKRNIKSNKIRNISAFKYGLSDISGKSKINLYSSSGNNSVFERKIPEGHPLKKTDEENIDLYTLDELIFSGKVLPPDIIKIDVEGSELNVLKGALKTIKEYKPAILMEYSSTTSSDAGYRKEKLLEVTDFKDYSIFGIPEDVNDIKLIQEIEFKVKAISTLLFIPKKLNVVF